MWSDNPTTDIARDGTGTLVLVVGPSGAGKDLLMRLARERLSGEADVVFARRVVTRPSSSSEDHDSLSPEAFADAEKAGAFCLSWSANGLDYGLPSTLLDEIRRGRTVVANGSRAVVSLARQRFPHVACVLVTAPPDVLAARLANRQRTENIHERLLRAKAVDLGSPADAVIDNVGLPEEGADLLVSIVRRSQSETSVRQGP